MKKIKNCRTKFTPKTKALGFHFGEYCEIFKRMHPSIVKLSNFSCSVTDVEFSDAYQDICVFMLEGIPKYKEKLIHSDVNSYLEKETYVDFYLSVSQGTTDYSFNIILRS